MAPVIRALAGMPGLTVSVLNSGQHRDLLKPLIDWFDFRVDADRKNPYSDQFIGQVEQELRQNLGLQVNYVYKRGENYGGWEDIAGTYAPFPYVDSVGLEASGQTFNLYRLTSPASLRVFSLTTPLGPDGRGLYSRYQGATFMLTKRMSVLPSASSRPGRR